MSDFVSVRLHNRRHLVGQLVASQGIGRQLIGKHLEVDEGVWLLELDLKWEHFLEGQALTREAEHCRLAIVKIGNMPVEHVVGSILLDVDVLLQELRVGEAVSHVDGDGHVLERLELQVLLVLVVLDFHRDHVLALLLRVEHVDCEWQVFLGLARVPVPERVEACLGRDAFSALLARILASQHPLLIPGLLIEFRMDFEGEALEVVELHRDLRMTLFGVRQGQVEHALELKLFDIAVFCKLARDALVDLQ